MRSRLYSLYEDFYYNFERSYNCAVLRWQEWKKRVGVRYDASFRKAYKNVILPYWARYGVRPRLAMVKSVYDVNGKSTDPRYIPDDIWTKYIVPHFNDCRFSKILADKNLNSLIYPGVKRPETLFKRMSGQFCLDDFTPISREDAIDLCSADGTWVVKPSIDSFQGKNVQFFSGGDSRETVLALLAQYEGTDYIVQRAVVQHPALSALNSTSVNTVRIITLVLHEKAFIASSILRVGMPGSRVDNIGSGGWQFDIRPDGHISTLAYIRRSGTASHEEMGGEAPFADFCVPGFSRVCETALELAERTPHLRLIAWDFSVDEFGDPVLIEFNARSPGQNQETSGPSFRDRTEEVLAEVFGKGETLL